jgi:hypothetical protein
MSASIAGPNQQGDHWQRPLRQRSPLTVQPVLLPDPPPQVATATGFGIGGGAGIGRGSTQAYGHATAFVGLAPSASGVLTLAFANPIPAGHGPLFAAASWASLIVTGSNPYAIAWTATRPLVAGERLQLAYQWSVSQ